MGDGSTRRKPAPPREDDARSDQFDLFGAQPLSQPPSPASSSGSGGKRKRAARGRPGDASRDVAASGDASPSDDMAGTPPTAAKRAPGANGGANDKSGGDADAPAAPPDSAATPTLPGFDAPPPAAAPRKRARRRGVAPAAITDDIAAAARALPPHVRLGTSSWYFPGWKGIVYGDDYAQSKLSREGLEAYAAHPLLKSVSLDRSFYAPLTVADYLRYAQQVPDDFRFVVKAPALVTDAVLRGARGEPTGPNPAFLNARLAADEFVRPCLEGLGNKAGALVFQFPPMPDTLLADPAALVDRLSAFLCALPPLPPPDGSDGIGGPDGPRYAVEIRDASLLTPRFIRALAAAGVRYCVGLHAKMPDPLRQAAALALLDGEPSGPLIVRWSLHSGFKYEQAKAKYEPFDRLVDEDPHTRTALAELAARYVLAGQPVLITVNNKAEGSAPLSCIALAKEIAAACARWRGEAA
ncbi:DUF72 domain-containing protein [Burkholderia humptydooensis]|uniref:DUF72 domain-containing protein n=3 Tax=Burkholderia humptydooensis TaxID=430531 RepID=A0A7U4ST68_9BURK|nr:MULTISPECIES: DUF72 domain-containing protein [Burkholderia]ALX43553.1 hypothetical protein AQ610_14850 [Burkholderia humptydooensis]EIP90148.1 hypothetical protein A33K_13735 [Burkholderia humptydooensis MSMB43]QPS44525.1 DUF72 domain-containing protein [Burkholderia humptydooensis]